MKDFSMLVWLTQLGLGAALPLAGFVFGAIWLRNKFSLGPWIVICGMALGLICAIYNLHATMKSMAQMSKAKDTDAPPPVSFNDHD